MLNLKKITLERAAEISAATNGDINFKVVNGAITEVVFPGPNGPLFVQLESYSVSVCERQTKTVYIGKVNAKAAGTDVRIRRQFDHEHERQDWLDTLTEEERAEVQLSEEEVIAE